MTQARPRLDPAGSADPASVLDPPKVTRLAAGAGVQAVLTAVGETVYEWDVATDRIRWGGNAAEVLGVPDTRVLSTGESYDTLLHPDSFTNRHQAVLNGIGVDYGDGVPFDVTYALRLLSDGGLKTVWVHDCGVWFADAEGAPYLARGVLRRCRSAVGRSTSVVPRPELPRRAAFLRILNGVLAMAAHYKTGHAFVALAIDNLPLVARSYGVPAVEELEAGIGDRIRAAVRGGDVVGWLSESELGLILSVDESAEAAQAVDRIVRAISPVEIPTTAGAISPIVAAGVVIAPFQAATLNECLSRARRAQQLARSRGPGHHVFFQLGPEGEEPAHSDAEIAEAVQRAIRDSSATLGYQPVLRASDGRRAFDSCSLAFLANGQQQITWREAQPIVRALGLSRLVDRLAVDQAIVAMGSGTILELQVSADTLRDPEFTATLAAKLSGAGVAPERLTLQVSEVEIGDAAAELEAVAAELRRIGCRLCISQFGAGFLARRTLQLLKPGRVKLDVGLTATFPSRQSDLARELVGAAKTLGAEVVVESTRSVDQLAAAGVDYVQQASAPLGTESRSPDKPARKTVLRSRKVA